MNFRLKETFNTVKKIFVPVVIIFIVIFIFNRTIMYEHTLLSTIIALIVNGGIGLAIYLAFTYKNGALNDVFGEEHVNNIIRKIKPKKQK